VKRIVMSGGVLELHEGGMLCMTASGPQVTATYQVDGRASTGSSPAHAEAATSRSTSQAATKDFGTLILAPPAA